MHQVRDVMATGPLTVLVHTSLAQAAQIMRDRNTREVLITDGRGHLTGILTSRDMVVRGVAASLDPTLTGVERLATPNPFTISSEADQTDAAAMMRRNEVHRLPVVDHGAVVGIIRFGQLDAGDVYAVENTPEQRQPMSA